MVWWYQRKCITIGVCEEYEGGLDSGRMSRTLARVDNVD